MQSRAIKVCLMAGAAALLPAAVNAQAVRNLDNEQSNVRSFAGVLQNGPAMFEVAIPEQITMQIDVIATSDLDPVIKVFDISTGELIAENDDGGDDLNSRVFVRGEAGRRVRLEVDSFGYEGFDREDGSVSSASFDLRLTGLIASANKVRSVSWGSSASGQLISGDKHEFTFEGEEGLLLEVALVANDEGGSSLDPYLELLDASGQVISSNDDGGDGLNSLLRHVMQDNANYTIVASGLGDSGGAYTLRVGPRREPIVQAPVQVVGIGDSAPGRLGAGYENGGIDPSSIDYQLSEEAMAAIRAGSGGVTIRMMANSVNDADFASTLDPFLELGFETPLGFAVVQEDDDSAGDLNSMITVDLSSVSGNAQMLESLRIRVSGLGGSEGEYTLSVSEGMEPVEAGYEDYDSASL